MVVAVMLISVSNGVATWRELQDSVRDGAINVEGFPLKKDVIPYSPNIGMCVCVCVCVCVCLCVSVCVSVRKA